MAVVFLVFAIAAIAAIRVVNSQAICYDTAGPSSNYRPGVSTDCPAPYHSCFERVNVSVTDATKTFEKGCSVCNVSIEDVAGLSKDGRAWEMMNCCDANIRIDRGCNYEDISVTKDLGPKCWECNGDVNVCVKGGNKETARYLKGSRICNVMTSQCFVEKKASGHVKRGCIPDCVNEGSVGDDEFRKCCRDGDYCNSYRVRVSITFVKDGNNSDTNGEEAVLSSFFLLIFCFLLTYLK